MESCILNFLERDIYIFLVKTIKIIVFIQCLGKKIILESIYLYENENYALKNSEYGHTFILKLENSDNFFVTLFEICYIIL